MKRWRAFSLIELTLTVCLSLLLVVIGWVGRNAGRGGGARGIAEMVAEQLRAARQQAISTSSPVAFVVPSQGGLVSQAQAFYTMAGQSLPRVTHVENLQGSFPEYSLFVGVWSLTSGSQSAARPAAQFAGSELYEALPKWLSTLPSGDFALVFTPSGTVVSNGLAHFDGSYHLVVARGVDVGGEAPPADADPRFPNTHMRTLLRASEPYTVSLSQTGAVSVEPGVKSSAISPEKKPLPIAASAAPPARSGVGANSDPVILGVDVSPGPQWDTYRLNPGQHLSMRVRAYDPDGDPMYLRWYAEAAPRGTFSASVAAPMANYSPMSVIPDTSGGEAWVNNRDRVWEGRQSWRAPDEAGWSESVLRCEVIDARGGRAQSQLGTTGVVQLATDAGKVAFITDGNKLTVMNADGSQRRSRSWGPNLDTIAWAPDGKHLAISERDTPERRGGIRVVDDQLYDVSREEQPAEAGIEVSWNFLGNRILGTWYSGLRENLVFINSAAGAVSGGSLLNNDTGFLYNGASWSHDSRKVVYSRFHETALVTELRLYDFSKPEGDPDRDREIGRVTGDRYLGDVSFSPTTDRIAYCYGDQRGERNTHQLRVARIVDGEMVPPVDAPRADQYIISEGENLRSKPAWAYDGRHVAFCTQGARLRLWVRDLDVNEPSQLIHEIELDGAELGEYVESPCWRPDGHALVFIYRGDLYRARLSGTPLARDGEVIQVTNTPDEKESHPRWSI